MASRTNRTDPTSKHVDLGFDQTRLKGANPQKRYVCVHPDHQVNGVDAYESEGWEVVKYQKGGVSFARGKTAREGEPVTYMGMVLMSIDRTEAERLDYEGALGGTGQRYLDRVRQQIVDPRGGADDAVSRMSNRYVRGVNETEPERYVSA